MYKEVVIMWKNKERSVDQGGVFGLSIIKHVTLQKIVAHDFRYDPRIYVVFMQNILYSFPILMKLEFSRWFFEKYSYVKFHENPSGESRAVPCGKTDGRI